MPSYKHKVATGAILSYMKLMGYYGYSSYWSTIYYRTEADMNTQTLRNHELKHMDQMKEEGKVVFAVKYLWYAMTVGYKANPYEIQSRAAERAGQL